MHISSRVLPALMILLLISWQSFGQFTAPVQTATVQQQCFDSSMINNFLRGNPAWMQRTRIIPGTGIRQPVHQNQSVTRQAKNNGPFTASHTLGSPTCTDTSNNIFTREAGRNIGPGGTVLGTRDGDIVMPGAYQNVGANYVYPYILKYDAAGNVMWSKYFGGPNIYPVNYANAYKSFELNDGSLLVTGNILIPEDYNGRYEMIIWKLDASGNLIWVQTDSCSIWDQYSGRVQFTGMAQDATGNIYLCGNQFAFDAITTHSLVLKMDPSGNVLWDKNFTFRSSECYGILFNGAELSVYGTHAFVNIPDGSGNLTAYLWNLRMNPATGDTLGTKCWYPDYGVNSGWNSMFWSADIQRLNNGHIAVFGPAVDEIRIGQADYVHGISAEFDPSFNFVKGSMVRSTIGNNNYIIQTRITEQASGRISYTYLSAFDGHAEENRLFGAIEKGQILKERVLHQRGYDNVWSTNFIHHSPGEDINVGQIFDSVNADYEVEFLRMHDSDTSSECTGKDTVVSWLEPYAMLPFPYFRCDSIASNTFRRSNRLIPSPTDGNPLQESACKLLSFCDSLKLSVNMPSFCAGQPAIFTTRRNPECGSRPLWSFDRTNLESDSIWNDSTLVLTYKDQFQGKVYVSMNGTCRNLSDSVSITVQAAGTALSLGPDGYLCPDSLLVLRAAKGFGTYTWQDGSTADTLLVQSPGKYYLTVMNSCGLPLSDTVLIQQAPSLNFSVGADTAYCLHDPVQLQAPGGYSAYSWRTIAGDIYPGQSVTVTPPVSTSYFAAARTALGCVVKDTIQINIRIPTPVLLGTDTSFCSGDSVLLNAGSGFLNYSWNTGATDASVWVRSKGIYSVAALSANGCYSRDTFIVKNIYPLPDLRLDAGNILCAGSTRTLNAGDGYADYVWQDESRSSTLVVNTLGTYWVQVMDLHGCVSGDTVLIDQLIAKPAGFLMTDTLVCDGYPSRLQSTGTFNSYSWSTGDKKDFILVRKGGNYTLTVQDSYGCSGTETVAVSTKQCVFGIFFPNAFSPNKDGVNDIFRPSVFGNITKYNMQIFNRWGQKVFESEDYTRGWDGSLEGMEQVNSTFVWICRYQFAGEPEKTEKGSIVLLR